MGSPAAQNASIACAPQTLGQNQTPHQGCSGRQEGAACMSFSSPSTTSNNDTGRFPAPVAAASAARRCGARRRRQSGGRSAARALFASNQHRSSPRMPTPVHRLEKNISRCDRGRLARIGAECGAKRG
eukprot:1434594-Rhodomonas_salina.2